MKISSYIFLFFSLYFFSSNLIAQCSVITGVISDYNGQHITCAFASDGIVAAQGSGGTAPYTFQWDDPSNTTNDTLFNIPAGVYYVTLTDNIGCTAVDSVVVVDPPELVASTSIWANPTCFGFCDGAIQATAVGGTSSGTFIFNWSDGSTAPVASGLCVGTYSVMISDDNGCLATPSPVTLQEPTQLVSSIINVTDPSNPLANDGSATATAIGGSPPYAYIWSSGETTATIWGLPVGIYCVTVVDGNGCNDFSCVSLIGSNHTLEGVVRLDTNNNCFPDTMEQLMSAQIIKSTNTVSGDIRYFTTDYNGRYRADLAPGNYTLEYFPINSLYSSLCVNTLNINIPSTTSLDTVNWALETGTPCHLMDVSIGAPFLRRAGGGSHYTVHYCNNGTLPAYDSYVSVEIDSFLTVTSTSLPIASQVGNVYRFDLDTVNAGECGNIYIGVVVNSNAINGQTHCSKAHIYPDTFCLPLWSGPILEAEGTCDNDSIFFKITNLGSNMLASENYAIFEDDIIIRLEPFNLNGGNSITIAQYADSGSTYRIQTYQASGFPPQLGANVVHAAVEGCRPFSNGTFHTSFLTQFYTGNTSPFIDIDCQPNVASFDPNDKQARIQGYGSANYIEANTPLDYKIRFQNTGTDTAFNIVIIDTLSSHVNPTSLQMGASSHAYTWTLDGAGILTVNFDNIMLVDSNTNEPLSHGFFTYTIDQSPNLPNGTVINNQAAIYFDFNAPIFTNTTVHTIGENFVPIVLTMKETWIEALKVLLYPNPTSGQVYIEQLDGQAHDLYINVFDNLGREIAQYQASGEQTTIDLKDLPSGVYYIHVRQDQRVSTHKLVKH